MICKYDDVTTDYAKFGHDFLGRIAKRIIN